MVTLFGEHAAATVKWSREGHSLHSGSSWWGGQVDCGAVCWGARLCSQRLRMGERSRLTFRRAVESSGAGWAWGRSAASAAPTSSLP